MNVVREALLSISVCALFLPACRNMPSPEAITRSEQNFDKIEIGMTKDEVVALTGKPYIQGTRTLNVPTPESTHLRCMEPPCSWDLWALNAQLGKDDDSWPIVVYDRNTHRVIDVFRGEIEYYFAL